MKKILILLLACMCYQAAQAQSTAVEKSMFGIQAGLLGLWVHNEARLSNNLALRSELGFDSGLSISKSSGTTFAMAPVFTLEPRWYYNLGKRVSKGKSIAQNTGNFTTVKLSYTPDWFLLGNREYINVPNQISILPIWGIRRQLGEIFNFEAGLGLGFRYVFKSPGYPNNEGEAAVNLHLRFGFQFSKSRNVE